jgi:hypothetical protein
MASSFALSSFSVDNISVSENKKVISSSSSSSLHAVSRRDNFSTDELCFRFFLVGVGFFSAVWARKVLEIDTAHCGIPIGFPIDVTGVNFGSCATTMDVGKSVLLQNVSSPLETLHAKHISRLPLPSGVHGGL